MSSIKQQEHRHRSNIFHLIASTTALVFLSSTSYAQEYGVDVSFPMHRDHIIDTTNNLIPDRQAVYDEYMNGCRSKYSKYKGMCEDSENGRVEMNFNQPSSMQNYTEIGFKKMKCPEKVWKLLKEFWDRNNPTNKLEQAKEEMWSKGNSYVNHWVSPSYMVSVEDTSLRGGGYKLKDAIWDAAKTTLQEWTGEGLKPCSLYGIRIYTEGSILATHVDRLPLVSSAIVNVAQDVDEPWPLEVIGHDGKAHNITMEPGDMVLYESHSILHGRPFALKGRYFANVFIHFEPTGHTLRHHEKMNGGDVMADESLAVEDVHKKYKESILKGYGGHENETSELPPYIIKGTASAKKWLEDQESNDDDEEEPVVMQKTEGSTDAHHAVQTNDTETLLSLLSMKRELVHAQDENGWTPLHEAARTGSIDAVNILIENGADVNAKTLYGHTPLYLASQEHGDDHPVVDILVALGGLFEGPEL